MNQTILKRIERLENMKKNSNLPDLIIISEEGSRYRVMEQYCKYDGKGNVVAGSGTQKILYVDNIEDYKTPEGFNGVCINEKIED